MEILFQPDPILWIQRTLGPGLVGAFLAIGALGTSWGILLAASLALWLFGRRTLYALLALAAVEGVARTVLAGAFGVPRPDADGLVKYEDVGSSSSFPSGHVSTAAALWTYLGLATRFPLTLSLLMVAAVALGRLYLGVHYPADVVGGALLGVGLAWGWTRVGPRLVRGAEGWPAGVWIGIAGAALAGVAVAAFSWLGESPFHWNAAGFVAGGALALPVEGRYVRYRPPASAGARLRCLAVGLAGLAPLLVWHLLAGAGSLELGAARLLVATLWALLGAPALFSRWGWADGASGGGADRPEAQGRDDAY